MATTATATTNATEFYNENYYGSHFGEILQGANYFDLMAAHWKRAIFTSNNIDPSGAVLDYGCGLGQVSAALSNATLYDSSEFALDFLRRQGRNVINCPQDIPSQSFDLLLSSHSLEHCPNPEQKLTEFRSYLKPNGKLIVILPVEQYLKRTLAPDNNLHFFSWTFQTITNLLLHCRWRPIYQTRLYQPFGLRRLGSILPSQTAVALAHRLGILRRNYPAIMTVAELAS